MRNLDSYRRVVAVSESPLVKLSVIDIQPETVERTLVFLHGFGGQASDWWTFLHNFAAGNRGIAIDIRGHGKSDKQLFVPSFERDYGDWAKASYNRDAAAPMDLTGIGHYYDVAEGIRGSPKARRYEILFTMDLLIDDLRKVLANSEITDNLVLIGHSLGGAISAEYARQHPDSVKKLILINTPDKFQLKPVFRHIFNLPSWQRRLIFPFLAAGSSAAISRKSLPERIKELGRRAT